MDWQSLHADNSYQPYLEIGPRHQAFGQNSIHYSRKFGRPACMFPQRGAETEMRVHPSVRRLAIQNPCPHTREEEVRLG